MDKAVLDFYAQKAKYAYFKLGDRCTKFFHALVKQKVNKRHISAMSLEDGSLTSSSEQGAGEFVKHFQSLLGTTVNCDPIDLDILNVGPKLNFVQEVELVMSISNEDIRKALFNIGDDKSPGLDGYTTHFFKKS